MPCLDGIFRNRQCFASSATVCKVREEGIYILYTADNHGSGRHGQQDRHGKKEKEEEKSTGKDKKVNNDIVHIEGCKINSNK